ncbi:MAG: hypothetical protein LUF25_03805 [Phascolarctobacterium sp.]|nr:hypothetical protein [Phascolarctobacterium sp.]MCD8175287.1 hypothetical protein [Phascolarctobacterium sp.]
MRKKTIYIIVIAALILSVAIEMAGIHGHAPSWWPFHYGYNIFFGFVGCWALIIVAKMIMAPFLQRDEDYYDDGGDSGD